MTRSVRDDNERHLLEQRADAIGQLVEGLGSSFEADLVVAAAYAGVGSEADFAAYVEESRRGDTANSVWAVLEGGPDGVTASFVAPPGASTYFDGPPDPVFEAHLDEAFTGGGFTILGLFGAGFDRRLALAAPVPSAENRLVYLEFPLLVAAAGSDGADAGLTLFEGIDVGLYAGSTPTEDGRIFATYDGPVPPGTTKRTFDMGGQEILVVVRSAKPLSGEVADKLPLIVLGFGVSIGALAALLIEVSLRKQRAALALAEELRVKHAELDHAMAEQARAEAGLVEAQRKEALGQLAGGIAHDFNNLLSVIVGYAELANERTHEEAVRADLAEVVSAAQRAAALTRQLLLFARAERMPGESADLNAVISNLSSLLTRTVGEDVAIVVDLGADAAIVGITAGELEQLLVNLVVNARHAIGGSGLISIRTRNDPSQHHLVLEVSDDGTGMTPAVAARALEPFFTTRAAGEGSGLGLATVDSIVQNASGVTTIDSEVGKGTTIRVVLPVTEHTVDPRRAMEPTQDGPGAGAMTVLLVEDEEAVRRALRRMLEERGYRVHEAASGAEAVSRYLDTCVPDVLLTDVVMPGGLSGTEVVERFRTRHPDLPVVFVSGHAPGRLADRGVAAGHMHLLAKPFSERDLLAAIAAAVNESRPYTEV